MPRDFATRYFAAAKFDEFLPRDLAAGMNPDKRGPDLVQSLIGDADQLHRRVARELRFDFGGGNILTADFQHVLRYARET